MTTEKLNYEKARKKMFLISKQLKKLFDDALDYKDLNKRLNTLEIIKKLQEKCYDNIESLDLDDYKGGHTDENYGGIVDFYNPNTHKQNVIDLIEYFFVNSGFEDADDFNDYVSVKVHSHEQEDFAKFQEYSVDYLIQFYKSNAWEGMLIEGDIDKDILDIKKNFSMAEIKKINEMYASDEI